MYVVYLASDVFELPCAVLDSVSEVARWLGVDYWCAYRSISRGSVTMGYKIEYVLEAKKMAFKLKNLNRVIHIRLNQQLADYVAQNGSDYVRNLILKDMISKGVFHNENKQTDLDDLIQHYRIPRS